MEIQSLRIKRKGGKGGGKTRPRESGSASHESGMCYANARPRIPEPLRDLLRSEMEKAIWEAKLGEDDGLIADRYLIAHTPQADIAAELGCDQCTVARRMPHILHRVEFAAQKIGYI